MKKIAIWKATYRNSNMFVEAEDVASAAQNAVKVYNAFHADGMQTEINVACIIGVSFLMNVYVKGEDPVEG